MEPEYIQVKVYAVNGEDKLVELPDGAVGIIDNGGEWVYGPLPVKWSKQMLKNTLAEWSRDTWTKTGEAFAA